MLCVPKASLPIRNALRNMDRKQANYVGKLLIQVFVDAKSLTLAAFNWLARYVAFEASNSFSYDQTTDIIPDLSLQYINPTKHLELLSSIVASDIENIKKTINECLAISLRVDGSVDRSQKDKIYVLAKIVKSNGEMKLLFLGVAEQVERSASGLLKATLEAMHSNLSEQFTNKIILKNVSSLCTDGTNVNIGTYCLYLLVIRANFCLFFVYKDCFYFCSIYR